MSCGITPRPIQASCPDSTPNPCCHAIRAEAFPHCVAQPNPEYAFITQQQPDTSSLLTVPLLKPVFFFPLSDAMSYYHNYK